MLPLTVLIFGLIQYGLYFWSHAGRRRHRPRRRPDGGFHRRCEVVHSLPHFGDLPLIGYLGVGDPVIHFVD
jgi:hypothetical protein